MSQLETYFTQNKGRLIHKWHHYFSAYERHFQRFQGKPATIVEVGVFHGGSLQMWKNYFGQEARIYGIDINPRAKALEEENVTILIGSQSDRKFLMDVRDQLPPIDILIDDGGHRMKQQTLTFEILFEKIQAEGVYLCEDVLTSYKLAYGGGHRRRGTFIEYSKTFIDWLNAYHSEQRSLEPNWFTKTVQSVHYYDGIVVVEKGPHKAPVASKTGMPSFSDPPAKPTSWLFRALLIANSVLRWFRIRSFKL